jgi:hypothetical protein
MFFKHILILFIILGILGFMYGDKIFYFQAHFMMNISYDFPAYEAYEKIVRYYPGSPHRAEALKMMDVLKARNYELRSYIADKDKEIRKIEKDRAAKEEYR